MNRTRTTPSVVSSPQRSRLGRLHDDPGVRAPGAAGGGRLQAEAGAEGTAPAAEATPAATEVAPVAAPTVRDVPWQEFFTDERLRSVIDLALANNRDLRVATLNVERVAALYRIQRAELFPTIGVQATGERYRMPGEASARTARRAPSEQYTVDLGLASWELDLFGRIRSLNAARPRAVPRHRGGAGGARRPPSSPRSPAPGWASRPTRRTSGSREATLEAQRASHDLIRQSRDAGIGSDLELSQAASQVEAARAAVASFTGAVAVSTQRARAPRRRARPGRASSLSSSSS